MSFAGRFTVLSMYQDYRQFSSDLRPAEKFQSNRRTLFIVKSTWMGFVSRDARCGVRDVCRGHSAFAAYSLRAEERGRLRLVAERGSKFRELCPSPMPTRMRK